jgi:hypothetical protein
MDNETSTPPQWGRYWMAYIEGNAAEKGVDVCVTDMFDDGWNPQKSAKIRQAFNDPQAYEFMDISQVNSRTFNEDHWINLRFLMNEREAHQLRPMNHTKIYGSGFLNFGTGSPADGVERFWRDIFAGSASARFHRPEAGNGFNHLAQSSIRSMRMLMAEFDVFTSKSDLDHALLSDRESDEAYLISVPGKQYAVYFPQGGSVGLDLSGTKGTLEVKWLHVGKSEWLQKETAPGGEKFPLTSPDEQGWVALLAVP